MDKNMKFKRMLSSIFRFTFMKSLKRGGMVVIYPSWKCNYTCEYCCLKINGVFPKNQLLLSLEKWKEFLIKYDQATRENRGLRIVCLVGGEPTLLPYFVELCHWIMFEKKCHLVVSTNLSNKKLLEVKPSILLKVEATFHAHVDPVKFTERFKAINRIHRVRVQELIIPGKSKRLSYSKAVHCFNEEEGKIANQLASAVRVLPDQTIWLTYKDAETAIVGLHLVECDD